MKNGDEEGLERRMLSDLRVSGLHLCYSFHDYYQDHQRENHQQYCHHNRFVPTHKLRHTMRCSLVPCRERISSKVSSNVSTEGSDRCAAAHSAAYAWPSELYGPNLRPACERHLQDCNLQQSRSFGWAAVCTPFTEDLPDPQRTLAFQTEMDSVRQAINKAAPECVDIGCCRDPDTRNLLRAGIFQRHHPLTQTSDDVLFYERIQQSGIAEIQQLRHVIRRNENVRRFDVPMNHAILMCVLDGGSFVLSGRVGEAVP